MAQGDLNLTTPRTVNVSGLALREATFRWRAPDDAVAPGAIERIRVVFSEKGGTKVHEVTLTNGPCVGVSYGAGGAAPVVLTLATGATDALAALRTAGPTGGKRGFVNFLVSSGLLVATGTVEP